MQFSNASISSTPLTSLPFALKRRITISGTSWTFRSSLGCGRCRPGVRPEDHLVGNANRAIGVNPAAGGPWSMVSAPVTR